MGLYKIKRGTTIPLAGAPSPVIEVARPVSSVAVVAADVKGLKPRMLVEVGTQVKLGTPLFEDKETGIRFLSPGGGAVKAVHRGAKRRLLSVEVSVQSSEEKVSFSTIDIQTLKAMPREALWKHLGDIGCSAAFRQRPFGFMVSLKRPPHSIFVSVIDSDPLASHPSMIIKLNPNAFQHGLQTLAKLTDGYVHVCKAPDADIPHAEDPRVLQHIFLGQHPAGLVGTHIHHIDPITSPDKVVWYIGYQDVIRMGETLMTGDLSTERCIAIGGPQVHHPRILKTRLGADLHQLLQGELKTGENRIIAGSPLAGRKIEAGTHFIGLYHHVIAVLAEDRGRYFQDFMTAGPNKFSVKAVFCSAFKKSRPLALRTSLHGSYRAVVSIGSYEEVFPLKILATPLIKALLSKDLEAAEQLGALELEGEDLALCTFVCPGKNDISRALEEVLELIHQESQVE